MLEARPQLGRQDVLASNELIDLLKNESEDVALEAFRALRQGRSPRTILQSIGGDISSHRSPSPHATARSILPATKTHFEFQLVVQHPNVYPSLVPLDVASIDLQLLGIRPLCADNRETFELSTLSRVQGPSPDPGCIVNPQSVMERRLNNGVLNLVDPRVGNVEISRWTSIRISNRFAAEAITLYLEINQPWWALFDTDLFLNDLVSGRTRFCSPLLVNALLAWSIQSYAHYEPMMAANLSARFLDEATRLYEIEPAVDRLTTVAATTLMSMTWVTLGKDKTGWNLQCESARMAERLHLYGGPDNSLDSILDFDDQSVKTAASATAWGSFNFQMVMSMSYHREPLPKRPPTLPIPGEGAVLARGSGKPCFESTYASVCRFWLIGFEMNYTYYLERAINLPSAVALYQKFLSWADALQVGVEGGETNPDHVLNLHIWFHTAVIDLFRPFADEVSQPRLPAFTGAQATPAAVIEASIQQLKRLVYQYRSGFESAKYSIIWQSGMLYLVNHILRDFSSQEAQFYFLLCMRGYQHLARHMPFVSGVLQSLLAIAMRQGVILTKEAQRLCDEVRSENHRSQEFFSMYPVDLEIASKNLPAATLERLAGDFQELTVGFENQAEEQSKKPYGWRGDETSLSATLLPEEEEFLDLDPFIGAI